MRRFAASFVLIAFLLSNTVVMAGGGKVCKVLPQFLDKKGRQSLSPSLYERDAYQFYLRKHPGLRKSLRVEVLWKAKGVDWEKTRLRAELRGLRTNTLETITLEQPVKKSGFLGSWTEFTLGGDDFQKFGELVAWRVTLWEGDRQLSGQESFLWSGVPAR
ncbi:MAG: hypothetical protein ABSA83_03520 [Verrucomicrobiota bacterium]|jgi:hypothetical protein